MSSSTSNSMDVSGSDSKMAENLETNQVADAPRIPEKIIIFDDVSPTTPRDSSVRIHQPELLQNEIYISLSLDPTLSVFDDEKITSESTGQRILHKSLSRNLTDLSFLFRNRFSDWFYSKSYCMIMLAVLSIAILALSVVNEPSTIVAQVIFSCLFSFLILLFSALLETSFLLRRVLRSFDFLYWLVWMIIFVVTSLLMLHETVSRNPAQIVLQYLHVFSWFLSICFSDTFVQVTRKWKIMSIFLFILNLIRLYVVDHLLYAVPTAYYCVRSDDINSCISYQSLRASSIFTLLIFCCYHLYLMTATVIHNEDPVFVLLTSNIKIVELSHDSNSVPVLEMSRLPSYITTSYTPDTHDRSVTESPKSVASITDKNGLVPVDFTEEFSVTRPRRDSTLSMYSPRRNLVDTPVSSSLSPANLNSPPSMSFSGCKEGLSGRRSSISTRSPSVKGDAEGISENNGSIKRSSVKFSISEQQEKLTIDVESRPKSISLKSPRRESTITLDSQKSIVPNQNTTCSIVVTSKFDIEYFRFTSTKMFESLLFKKLAYLMNERGAYQALVVILVFLFLLIYVLYGIFSIGNWYLLVVALVIFLMCGAFIFSNFDRNILSLLITRFEFLYLFLVLLVFIASSIIQNYRETELRAISKDFSVDFQRICTFFFNIVTFTAYLSCISADAFRISRKLKLVTLFTFSMWSFYLFYTAVFVDPFLKVNDQFVHSPYNFCLSNSCMSTQSFLMQGFFTYGYFCLKYFLRILIMPEAAVILKCRISFLPINEQIY